MGDPAYEERKRKKLEERTKALNSENHKTSDDAMKSEMTTILTGLADLMSGRGFLQIQHTPPYTTVRFGRDPD